MKIKYLETRKRANGRIVFAVSPPPYVQQALEVKYELQVLKPSFVYII